MKVGVAGGAESVVVKGLRERNIGQELANSKIKARARARIGTRARAGDKAQPRVRGKARSRTRTKTRKETQSKFECLKRKVRPRQVLICYFIDTTITLVPPVQVDLTLDSDQVDLTLDSDSGPEVMVIDNPRTRRQNVPRSAPQNVPQSVPIPNPPRPAPVHEIILISPDRTPPRKPPDENSPTNQDSNNPLQYLPTPELQYLPTPELRYPSELSMNSLRRRSQSSVLDLSSMNLGTAARKACPVFPFPDPTPYVRPLGPSDPPDRPRTRPLPPGLRPGRASILGEHLLNATTDSRIVQILGIRELKANGWTLDRREQETAAPQPVEPVNNKGKGRAFGERTRDWTPLVQREELARITERQHVSHTPPTVQKRAVLHLVPPPVKSYNPAWTPIVHPPRQPRKRSAKPRDPTVKVEQHEWGFGLS
ncbi:hypothetical protein FRC08_015925 [Ceratobasidium sp. 394]|nr:hypothetical protein FRC08_015925 [Ceratobasidium sp. 394]